MKIKELILEYNLQNLLSLFQNKYEEIKNKDESNQYESLDEFIKSIENLLRIENKFQFIEPYMKWIVQRYVTGKLNKYEDLMSKVIPGLLKYDSLKRKNKLKPEHKDINQIKDINYLLDVLDNYKEEDIKSNKEKEKEIEENFYRNGEAKLVYNDSDYKIVIPKSEKASCFFGRNTRWCTAATQGKNYFRDYAKKGNLYIVIVKKENKRYQFHFKTSQFMDEKDQMIDFSEFYKKHPKMYNFFNKISKKEKSLYFKKFEDIKKEDIINELLKNNNNNIKLIISILKERPDFLEDKDFIMEILMLDQNFFHFFVERKKITNEMLFDIIEKRPSLFLSITRDPEFDFYVKNLDILEKEDFYINVLKKIDYTKAINVLMNKKIRSKLSKNFFQKIESDVTRKNFVHLFSSAVIFNNFDFENDKNLILSFIDEIINEDVSYLSDRLIPVLDIIIDIENKDIKEKLSRISLKKLLNIISKHENFRKHILNSKFFDKFVHKIKEEIKKENNDYVIKTIGYIYGLSDPKKFYESFEKYKTISLDFLNDGAEKGYNKKDYISECVFSILKNSPNEILFFLNKFHPSRKTIYNNIYSKIIYNNIYSVIHSDYFLKKLDDKIKRKEIKMNKQEILTLLTIIYYNNPNAFKWFGEHDDMIKNIKYYIK